MSRLVGLRIDIETRSRVPVKYGSYAYSECPDFRVLITSYSPLREVDGTVKMGKPRLMVKQDEAKFRDLILDPTIEKHAFNANFERVCLSRWLGMPTGEYMDPENWWCSAVKANVNGVFGTLDDVARAVRSPVMKDAQGKALIRFFSVPMTDKQQKQALASCGCRGFHQPAKHPVEFRQFEDYCNQDVLAEAGIASQFPETPLDIQEQYEADQRINDRGVRHFKALSVAAVDQVKVAKGETMLALRALTGVENPNSGQQMNAWLDAQGYPMVSLDKDHRAEALDDPLIPETVAEALTLRGQASLSSVTKHQAMLNTRSEDGRIRGSLQFYGAHTGREAGRGFQPQNLPRYEAPKADRLALLHGTIDPSDAPLAAKGTVRAAVVPARDHLFVVPDYNAIEARCLGWQSGEAWVEAEFGPGGQGKIYEATASQMFGVDKAMLVAALDEETGCGKCGSCQWCSHREKGKVSNLAFGYGGGAGALITMGAEAAGIDCGNFKELKAEHTASGSDLKFHMWERDRHDYPELLRLRDLYRETSPATVSFWKQCAKAWDIATAGKGARFGATKQFAMIRDGRHNRLVLPSGRSIWYRFAKSHWDPDRRPGQEPRIDRRTFIGKAKGVGHVRTDTHGGKLTENVTQAVARDVLFDLIMKVEALTAQGWPGRIVLHVHDEVVIEVHKNHADQVLADTLGLMSVAPDWAPGLYVKGAGSIMPRYKK